MYPKLFDIGPLAVHTYGCFLALAFVLAIFVQKRLARRDNVSPEMVLNLTVILIFTSLVGAKVLLFFVDMDYYLSHPANLLDLIRLGGVYYGGLISAIIVGILYTRKEGLEIWRVADILAPSIALGQAVGRIGCFLAGCCYGKSAAGLPWAVVFTDPYAYERVGVPLHVPLHPVQLYAALNTLCIFFILLYLFRRKSFHGQIFWTYMLLYALTRSILEIFRGDPRGFIIPDLLSTSQFIGILIVILSATMLAIEGKHKLTENRSE